MKILVSAIPGVGHWIPFIPIVQAAIKSGHSVTVASSEPMRGLVEKTEGVSFKAIGIPWHESKAETKKVTKLISNDWPISAAPELKRLAGVHDLILRGPYDAAAVIAAHSTKKTCVTLGYAVRSCSIPRLRYKMDPNEFLLGPFRDALGAYGLKNGLSNPSTFVGDNDHPVIDITPPALHPLPPSMYVPSVRSFRSEPTTPFEKADHSADAVVCFGSVVPNGPEWVSEELEKAKISAFYTSRDKPCDLMDALSKAKLFIHHGGWGTTMAALYSGVPSIALPLASDNAMNALRLHQTRAGFCAMTRDEFVGFLDRTDELLDPLRRFKSELDALDPIEDAVSWMEGISGKRKPPKKPASKKKKAKKAAVTKKTRRKRL